MNIKIESLFKRYPNGYEALKNINLEIKQGEFIAFIGLSGAGKTTLIKTINGLNSITAGKIYVGKFQVNKLSNKMMQELRKSVGIIFQGYNLVQQSSVLKNTYNSLIPDMPWFRRYLGIPNKAEKNKALMTLAQLNILRWAYTRADKLSGGQMQRVALAKTITQNPRIVLADEPVAALDPLMLKSVMDDFKRVNNSGVTIIANLHHIEVALKYADRIIGIKDGEIVYNGTSQNVTVPILEKIYGKKLKGISPKTIKMALFQKEVLFRELKKENLQSQMQCETFLEAKVRISKSKLFQTLNRQEKSWDLKRIALNLRLVKLIKSKSRNEVKLKSKINSYLEQFNLKTNLSIAFYKDSNFQIFLQQVKKKNIQLFSRINEMIVAKIYKEITEKHKKYYEQFQKEFINEITEKILPTIQRNKNYLAKIQIKISGLEDQKKKLDVILNENTLDKNIIKSLYINRQIQLYKNELSLAQVNLKRLQQIKNKDKSLEYFLSTSARKEL